ncbi:hypothetical protein [Jidongwangia harbinensis]|uniref:hypothetical protein n=1 Tax=Jidongwangia harbinensis TaxID=2878561 RepID=UPI001CD9F945|nr:hypothetical protein [Jidongwangia harbinensis]MCA2216212.1 hypothetical protein [Jidongwangia harbinensis]
MTASCRVTAVALGDGAYALRFTLANDGSTEIEVPSYEPFVSFAVRASAGGVAVPVHEPALDIGVNPTTLRVPAGGTVQLETPVRLRLDAEPDTDGFEWTVPHPRDGLSVQVELRLPAPFDVPCAVALP